MLLIAHARIRELAAEELGVLPAAERDRTFSAEGRRTQFLCGRWLLRSMLARLGIAAAANRDVDVAEHGKPYFEDGPAFSIAHAGEYVACCISDAGDVGIDLEMADTNRNLAGIAERFFSAEEAAWLATQPAEHFFMLWVLKEAWVKAHGLSIFGNMAEPGFRVQSPSIDVVGNSGRVRGHALFELPNAYLGLATCSDEPTGLSIERWDETTQSFVADESARRVAGT